MNKIETPAINVVLYLRVSTDEQAQKGFSLDYQEESLKRFCEVKGYNIVEIYREDHTAKTFKRPEWNKLQSYVKANKRTIDKVLFVKWDRFSRNVEEALKIIREFNSIGIEVNASEQYLDMTNPDNKMVLSIYLTAGEVERDKISGRTKDGTYQAKREGYYASRAPYGYDSFRDGNKSKRGTSKGKRSMLIPNTYAEFVTRAFQEVAMDVEPIETTRKRLYKEGMKLEKSSFIEMLKNIVYAGKIEVPEYKKEPAMLVDGLHRPLTDIATFTKVQEIFSGKRWHGLKPSHTNIEFPMRDFLRCEICGRQVTGSISKGRNKKYGYYHCRHKCPTRVSIEQTHDFISGQLLGLQINNNVKELFKDVLIDVDNISNGNQTKQLKEAINRRDTVKESIVEVEDMLLAKKISPENFNSMINRLNNDLLKANGEIEVLSCKWDSIEGYINDGLELLVNLDKLFLDGDYEDKRVLAGSLFTKKLIFGNEGCRTAEVNEVVMALTRFSKGSGGCKKEKAAFLGDFSATVPSAGVEPAWR